MAASATLTANTLEGQALEIARIMQAAELAIAADTRPNNVTIDPDLEALTVTISITLPVVLSGTGGAFTLSSGTYLA
jgi:hypothetical protein